MKCRDCNKDIEGEDFRKVADWIFCLDCFDRLLTKSEEKEEKAPEEENEEPEPLPQEPKKDSGQVKKGCSVCGIDIKKGLEKKLGTWRFCDKCYADLMYNPIKPVAAKQEETVAETTPETSESVFEKRNTNKVNCYGCGRQIFEAGANINKGNHFCPDCFYSLPEEERNNQDFEPEVKILTDSPKMEQEDKPGSIEAEKLMCESCERIIQNDNYNIIDGFNLCLACINTDEELALNVARDRHQKRLLTLNNNNKI